MYEVLTAEVLNKSILWNLNLKVVKNSFIDEAKAFQFDKVRFDRVIRRITYALYYDEYRKTWNRLLTVSINQKCSYHK